MTTENKATNSSVTTECERCDGSGLMYRRFSRFAARVANRPEWEGQDIQVRCTKCQGRGRVSS